MSNAPPHIDWIRREAIPRPFKAAMFDFDGTLSLLREDWPEIMCAMMVDRLAETGTGETREFLDGFVDHFVMQLNGKPTIHQMLRLVEEVRLRGGKPKSAEEYKLDYFNVLLATVEKRVGSWKTSGEETQRKWRVPGCGEILAALRNRGMPLYLVSGSDREHVVQELEYLGLSGFFPDRIHAPRGNHDGFLKKKIIDGIILENDIDPHQLIGFGDGVVETEDIAASGGFAVGVASRREADRLLHEAKKERLISAGASLVIPDYVNFEHWLDDFAA